MILMDYCEVLRSDQALDELFQILLSELPGWQRSIAATQYQIHRNEIRKTVKADKQRIIKLLEEI